MTTLRGEKPDVRRWRSQGNAVSTRGARIPSSPAPHTAVTAADPDTVHSYWLTTERLALRRFTALDLDWLAELYSDVDVTRYLGGVKSRLETRAFLDDRILQYYDQHPGLGIWMTVERTTGASVGFHLLNHIRGESIIQVGFALATSAWGAGFATEMADALLRHGFFALKLPRVAGMASLQNHASQNVLLKIGLERRGERSFPHPDYASQGAMAWFERDATEWGAERRPSQSTWLRNRTRP